MFSLDRWREIVDTLWRNKLRSALTAFAMAWGIFMLVVLLGLGNGLENGVKSGFADDATNSIWVFSGTTSRPHEGMPVGRRIVLNNRDVPAVAALPGVDRITGRFFIAAGRNNPLQVRVGAKISSYDVRAVHPDHLYLEKTIVTAGRFINDADIVDTRKIVVVGVPVAQFLFGTTDVIGRWIEIKGVPFEIVGVFTDEGEADEAEKVYAPISTAQAAFNGADRVNMLMFTTGEMSVAAAKALEQQARTTLAEAHKFSPDDRQAVRSRNNVENFENMMQIFRMIRYFVFAMAGCTLLAGIIGVSNIMMIAVRERTREIGVRKALGATPGSIVGAILHEALVLTSTAGYLGLIAGVGALALLEQVVPPGEMFAHPRVDLGIAVAAVGILVVAGLVAGWFPARAASRVNPIEALRSE
jgi:putative ABC transport system permease protein